MSERRSHHRQPHGRADQTVYAESHAVHPLREMTDVRTQRDVMRPCVYLSVKRDRHGPTLNVEDFDPDMLRRRSRKAHMRNGACPLRQSEALQQGRRCLLHGPGVSREWSFGSARYGSHLVKIVVLAARGKLNIVETIDGAGAQVGAGAGNEIITGPSKNLIM